MRSDPNRAIYFISDAHLSPRDQHRKQEKLLSFLRHLKGKAEILYIVGDFFDFWFEYGSVVPRGRTRVIFQLYDLARSGTRIIYVPGNHDFWVGSYFSEEVGVEVQSPEPLETAHHGRRIYIDHGDGIAGNLGYRIWKFLLLHPVCIKLFRMLHPDLGAALARLVLRIRYNRSSGPPHNYRDLFIQLAREKFREGFDLVVIGHFHAPVKVEMEGTAVILGDWIRHFTYGEFRNGHFALKKWDYEPEASHGVNIP